MEALNTVPGIRCYIHVSVQVVFVYVMFADFPGEIWQIRLPAEWIAGSDNYSHRVMLFGGGSNGDWWMVKLCTYCVLG